MTSGGRAPFKPWRALRPLILARSEPSNSALDSALVAPGGQARGGGGGIGEASTSSPEVNLLLGPQGVVIKVKSRLFHRLFRAESSKCEARALKLTVRLGGNVS